MRLFRAARTEAKLGVGEPPDTNEQEATGSPAQVGHSAPAGKPIPTTRTPSWCGADSAGMPARLRAQVEDGFAADFSDVRVRMESAHARAFKALAFTQGSEIHVAPGHWAPNTVNGRGRLLGHELAHVLQQRAGRVRTTASLGEAKLNDDAALSWNREADAVGARVAHAPAWGVRIAGASWAGTASPVAAPSGSVVQRLPAPEADPAHDPLLDEYSNDTGVPRNSASQHDPGYRAWLTFRGLDSLSVEELMATLTGIETRGGLNALITDSRFANAFHYTRLVTAMQVVVASKPGRGRQHRDGTGDDFGVRLAGGRAGGNVTFRAGAHSPGAPISG